MHAAVGLRARSHEQRPRAESAVDEVGAIREAASPLGFAHEVVRVEVHKASGYHARQTNAGPILTRRTRKGIVAEGAASIGGSPFCQFSSTLLSPTTSTERIRRSMRHPVALLTAALTAVSLLSACANSMQGSSPTLPSAGVSRMTARGGVRADAGAAEFAYVANEGSTNISGYKIALNGALTEIAGSPFNAGTGPSGIAVDPTGSFAQASNAASGDVSAYSIDASSGALKQVKGSPFGAGTQPAGVAIDPSSKFVYVANYGISANSSVSAFTIKSTGALAPVKGSPFPAGSGAQYIATDPTGKFVYVPNASSANVSGYKIMSNGALTPVPGSPFGAGSQAFGVGIDPTGKFAYVSNYGSDNVSAYTIDASNGTLKNVKGSPFGAATGPCSIVADPLGKFIYVPNNGSGNVSAYQIKSNGALTELKGSPFGAGSGACYGAFDSTGKYLYVVNNGANSISAYAVQSGGTLKPLKGSPFPAGNGPAVIATCHVKNGKCLPATL